MTAAHSQLRDLGLPPRDAEQTELHPDLNRAHVRFINLGKTYDGSVHALQGIDHPLRWQRKQAIEMPQRAFAFETRPAGQITVDDRHPTGQRRCELRAG